MTRAVILSRDRKAKDGTRLEATAPGRVQANSQPRPGAMGEAARSSRPRVLDLGEPWRLGVLAATVGSLGASVWSRRCAGWQAFHRMGPRKPHLRLSRE